MQVLGQGLEDALERQNNDDVDNSQSVAMFLFFKFTIKTLNR